MTWSIGATGILMWYIFLVPFTAEKCIRASPDEDYTNGFFVALFVRKDSETEQKPTECSGVQSKQKRKNSNEDTAEELSSQLTNKNNNDEPSLPLAHVIDSSDNNLSPRKKRRKLNKKPKDVKIQGEKQPRTSRGNLGLSNVKKKKNRKKKKKVSVCSW